MPLGTAEIDPDARHPLRLPDQARDKLVVKHYSIPMG